MSEQPLQIDYDFDMRRVIMTREELHRRYGRESAKVNEKPTPPPVKLEAEDSAASSASL
jgi:hypothetical protein